MSSGVGRSRGRRRIEVDFPRGALAVVSEIKPLVRAVVRAPVVHSVVIGVLALGIGANAAAYTIMKGFASRRLPVSKPEELFRVDGGELSSAGHVNASAFLSYPDARDLQSRASAMSTISLFIPIRSQLGGADAVRSVDVLLVSGNYFTTLGLKPLRGRLLRPEEDGSDQQAAVAVISEGFWRSYFGAAEDIVGRVVKVGDASLTVVGVLPSPFVGTRASASAVMWAPIGQYERVGGEKGLLNARDVPLAMVVGRKHIGGSLNVLQSEFDRIAQEISLEYPAYHAQYRFAISDGSRPLTAEEEGPRLKALAIVWVLVVAIHLIACSNVANILLARGIARRREMATRMALGATRNHIIRQLLAESVVISSISVTLGIAFAASAVRLAASRPGMAAFDFRLDASVVGLAAATGIVTSVAFGLAPALEAARVDILAAMKDTSASGRRTSWGSGWKFVSGQIGLSIALVAFAGTAVTTARRAARMNPGFDVEHLAFASIVLPDGATFDPVVYGVAFNQLRQAVEGAPGVLSVAASQDIPLSTAQMRAIVVVPGYTYSPHEDQRVGFDNVSPGYFRAMGIRLVEGSDFNDQGYGAGWQAATGNVIVNQAFAKHYWHLADPVGREVLLKGRYPARVIGVVEDTRDASVLKSGEPRYYISVAQSQFSLIVHASQFTPAVTAALRERISRSGLGVSHPRLQLGSDLRSESLRIINTTSASFQALAVVALGLASLGLYGLISFSVEQRSADLGLRLALGARPRHIHQLVARMTSGPLAVGLVLGVALTWVEATTGMTTALGIDGINLVVLVLAVGVLVVFAFVAAILPTRRALRIDPMRVVKEGV